MEGEREITHLNDENPRTMDQSINLPVLSQEIENITNLFLFQLSSKSKCFNFPINQF